MDWTPIIDRVLEREGGYSDRAEDKGGPTNRGITLATYSAWLDRPATVDEIKALTENEARMIYLQMYVKDPGLDLLGSEVLQEAMFDWLVNSGPRHAIKSLQRHVGVVEDGILGAATASAATTKDGVRLAQKVCWDRVTFIADWMRKDKRDADRDGVPDSMENAAGILRRVADLGRSLA